MEALNYEKVAKYVKGQIFELLGVCEQEIGDDVYLVEKLGATSLVILQLYLNCQERYDVRLADDLNLIEPVTVRSLSEKIMARIEAEQVGNELYDEESQSRGVASAPRAERD